MENKLGISDNYFESIETKLVNMKLNTVDYTFSFNETKFDLEYLSKLNNFLFSDLYYDCEIGFRSLEKIEKRMIENVLKEIVNICLYEKYDINKILNLIAEIWYQQPFNIGNTRTLIAFIKILNGAFNLNLDVDVNKEIKSGLKAFEFGNIVNQKRLTMNK